MKISELMGNSGWVPNELSILFNDTLSHNIQKKFIEHIINHKYFLNQGYLFEIDISKAFNSWVEYVYSPTINTLIKQKMITGYDDLMIGYLFFDIQDTWNKLKEKYPKEEKIITIKNAIDYFYVEEYKKIYLNKYILSIGSRHLYKYLFKKMKLKLLGII